MMALRMFIHGLESNNQGTKAIYFREKFPGMLTPNFPCPLDERMARLREILSGQNEILLVGSSFGGL
ncbi:MAG: alpha/beta hydrolase, partial [Deltaproteobacteria bacterium]|nr:alpha/beta hydrolase [Deltaproteobacteria bacterium]